MRTGELGIMSMFSRLPHGMGMDVAGEIVQVGQNVSAWSVSDRVLAMSKRGNAFADFTIVDGSDLVRIPPSMSYSEAACLPMGGATAWAVAQKLAVAPGERVLVNGAGGGIGLFLVQFLVQAGADVTATGGPQSLGELTASGAREAVDYRKVSQAIDPHQFAKIIDMSSKWGYRDAQNLLAATGVFYTMTPDASAVGALVRTLVSAQKMRLIFAPVTAAAVRAVVDLFIAGKLRISVGAERPLAQAIETLREVENGQLKVVGKVVLVNEAQKKATP